MLRPLCDRPRDVGGRRARHDGKTLRRSFDDAARANPLAVVTAFAPAIRLVVGQQSFRAAKGGGEIVAARALLECLAFYDFPAEHWEHVRTTNPIESVFATVRHRTIRTKGALSRETAKLMVFKLITAASKTWRRLQGENQLPKVIQGRHIPQRHRGHRARITERRLTRPSSPTFPYSSGKDRWFERAPTVTQSHEPPRTDSPGNLRPAICPATLAAPRAIPVHWYQPIERSGAN